MAEPTTHKLVLVVSSALKLNIDHLDIKTAFLIGEIPENEQFLCSPPPGLKVPEGMGWPIKKGLYGAHQSRSIWAKPFHAWMHKHYSQYVDAGTERCIYVTRESKELSPIDLDEFRELKIEKDEERVIMITNTNNLLIRIL